MMHKVNLLTSALIPEVVAHGFHTEDTPAVYAGTSIP